MFGYYAGSLVSYQGAGGQFQLYDSYGARFSCNNSGGIWNVTGVNLRSSDVDDLLKAGSMESFLKGMGFSKSSLAMTAMDKDGNVLTTKKDENGNPIAVKDLTEKQVSDGYEVATTAISGDLYSKLVETLSSGVNFSASIQVGSGVTGPSLTISENGKPQITYTSDPITGGIRPTTWNVYDDNGFQIGVETATFEMDSTKNGAATGHWTNNYTAITYDKNGVRTDTTYQFYSWSSDPAKTVKEGNLLNDIPSSARYSKDGYYDKDGNRITESAYKKLSDEDKTKYTYKQKGTVNEDALKEYMKENGMVDSKGNYKLDGQISSVTHYSANNSALYSFDHTTNQTTYYANNRPSYVVNSEGTTVGLYSYSENGVMTAYFNANGTDANGNKVGTTTIFDDWGRNLFTAVGGLNDGSNPFKSASDRAKLMAEYNEIIKSGEVNGVEFKYNASTGTYDAKEGTGTRISSVSIYTDQMFDKNSAGYQALTTNGFLDMDKVNKAMNAFKNQGDSISITNSSLTSLLEQFGLSENTFDIESVFAVNDEKNKREQMEYGNNKFATAIFDLVAAISGKNIKDLEKSGDFTLKNGKLTLRDGGKSANNIVSYINKAVKNGNLNLSSMLDALKISHGSIDNNSAEAKMASLYVLTGMLDMLSVNTGFNTTGATNNSENNIQKALLNISNVATQTLDSALATFTDGYKKSAGQTYVNLAKLANKVNDTAVKAIGSSVVKIARNSNSVNVDADTEYKAATDNLGTSFAKAKNAANSVKSLYANRNGGDLTNLNRAFGGALNTNLSKLGYTATDIINMLRFSNGGATAVASTSIAASVWDKDNIPGVGGVDGTVDMDDVNVTSVTKTNGSVTSSNSGSHIQYSVQNRDISSNTEIKCAAGMTFTNTIMLGGAQAYSTQRNVVSDIYEETNITIATTSESDPAVRGTFQGTTVIDGKTYVKVSASEVNIMDGNGFQAADGETVLVDIDSLDEETKAQIMSMKEGDEIMFMGDVKASADGKTFTMTVNTSYSGGVAMGSDIANMREAIQSGSLDWVKTNTAINTAVIGDDNIGGDWKSGWNILVNKTNKDPKDFIPAEDLNMLF